VSRTELVNSMTDAFYDFEWTVAPRYVWEDWVDEAGRPITVPDDEDGVLDLKSTTAVELTWKYAAEHDEQYGPVLRPVIGKKETVRRYRPMDRPYAALFREFADLNYLDKSAILAFATRYGSLGIPTQQQGVRVREKSGARWDHNAYGEPYLGWAVEVCLMREGLRLDGRKRVPTEKARRAQWLFNRHLQRLQGRIGFDDAGQPRLKIEPLTLISAMWLQLALATSGDKQFVACKFCHRMFEISTEQTGFRSHREFCTDSCKTKDYRKRRRTALRLAAAGSSVKEISDKTRTESGTVRSWLAAAKLARGAKAEGA
jgi:hypothetical protein